MSWQDIVLSITIILAGYALIPQVIDGFRKKKGLINYQTSIIYSLAIYTAAIVFITLNLYFSAVLNFIIGTLWLILLVQKIIYSKKR
jgi:hypothetical protein